MAHLDDFRYLGELIEEILKRHPHWNEGLENFENKNNDSYVKKLIRSSYDRFMKFLANKFGVNIEYSNGYTITNPNNLKAYDDDGNPVRDANGDEVLDNNGTIRWLADTVTVNDTLLDYLSIQNRILLESIPEEKGYLRTMSHAMMDSSKLRVHYKRYGSNTTNTKIVEPYCIKLYNQRWYLLAHISVSEKEYYTMYAFDRIEKIDILNEKFVMPADFNAEEFFKYYYGVYLMDIIKDKIPSIKFRVYGKETRSYIEDLKIHNSQRMLYSDEDNDFSDYVINVQPTDDLLACFLSHGSSVQILEPEDVKKRLIEKVNMALKHYN